MPRSVPKQRPWPYHQPPPTKPGDIFAFYLRRHNRWTTTYRIPPGVLQPGFPATPLSYGEWVFTAMSAGWILPGPGAPDSAIMRQGRWSSSIMVAKYTRGESAGDAPVARMNRPGPSHFGSAVPRSSARAAVHQTEQVLPARSGREIPGTKTDPATGPGLFRGSKVASSRGGSGPLAPPVGRVEQAAP